MEQETITIPNTKNIDKNIYSMLY